jgi:hypothetical protein
MRRLVTILAAAALWCSLPVPAHAGCNPGVLQCGTKCINICTPQTCVCCPDDTGAPTEADCGTTNASSCAAAPRGRAPAEGLGVVSLAILGLTLVAARARR